MTGLRIIGGTFKGRRLLAPRGLETRPLPDRIKQALFDWLGQRMDGLVVVDCCAGSGAFAFEALSRGARRVEAIEPGTHAVPVLRANAARLGNPPNLVLHALPFRAVLPRLDGVDLLFADPPFAWYADDAGTIAELLRLGAGCLAPTGRFVIRPLVLGPLSVWPPVVLAPMAGVTTYPFRSLCRAFGAGLYVSEMITARGFLEGNARTQLLASSGADERPRSVQVYGSDPDVMGEMARRLSGEGVHHIDMNFGCPAPKITRHGGGSAIPLKPRLMARLVRAAVRGAGRVPVTVKVRKGIHDGLLTYLDAGRVAEEEGAAAIGLHARTAAQLYAGDADWSAIAALKAAV